MATRNVSGSKSEGPRPKRCDAFVDVAVSVTVLRSYTERGIFTELQSDDVGRPLPGGVRRVTRATALAMLRDAQAARANKLVSGGTAKAYCALAKNLLSLLALPAYALDDADEPLVDPRSITLSEDLNDILSARRLRYRADRSPDGGRKWFLRAFAAKTQYENRPKTPEAYRLAVSNSLRECWCAATNGQTRDGADAGRLGFQFSDEDDELQEAFLLIDRLILQAPIQARPDQLEHLRQVYNATSDMTLQKTLIRALAGANGVHRV